MTLYNHGEIAKSLLTTTPNKLTRETFYDAWNEVAKLEPTMKAIVVLRAYGFDFGEVTILLNLNSERHTKRLNRKAVKIIVERCYGCDSKGRYPYSD